MVASLSRILEDPKRLQQLSQGLLGFGQGIALADARGLSPFASLALGFGGLGQGVQQARSSQAQEQDRLLQRDLAQERLRSSQQRRRLTERRAGAETAVAEQLRTGDPLAAAVAESGDVGAAAGLVQPKPPRTTVVRSRTPTGDVQTQLIDATTGEVIQDFGTGPSVQFQPQTAPGAVEKKERTEAKERLRETIGGLAQATAQLQRLNEVGGGVTGLRGMLSENVGGALGQLPFIGEGAEEAFTEFVSGASPEEVQNFMTNSRALVARLVGPLTGEESGRITENERALAAQASRLATPTASPPQVRAALQTVVQLDAIIKDRLAIQAGAPVTFDLETDEGIDAMGERLVEFGLTEDLAIQTLRVIRRQRRELRESGIQF